MGKEKGEPEMTKCPECGHMMMINNPRRPIILICRKCGSKVSIDETDDGLEANLIGAPASAKEGYKPKIIKCTGCGEKIIVKSPERPIVITCPTCGKKGKVSI